MAREYESDEAIVKAFVEMIKEIGFTSEVRKGYKATTIEEALDLDEIALTQYWWDWLDVQCADGKVPDEYNQIDFTDYPHLY